MNSSGETEGVQRRNDKSQSQKEHAKLRKELACPARTGNEAPDARHLRDLAHVPRSCTAKTTVEHVIVGVRYRFLGSGEGVRLELNLIVVGVEDVVGVGEVPRALVAFGDAGSD